MSTTNPSRAAIYTRVSTDDQAREGYSLDEQKHRGLQLIDREGWTHAGTFSDPGRSGADRQRPDLQRLLADVAAARIDVVLVAALDRLSRDAGHLREILMTFDAAGVRVIASGMALDRETPEGILQTGILAEFAEFERRKIKARTKAGIASRARTSGKPWGSSSAYGYRKHAGGDWEPDPVEAEVYRRIFRDRVERGLSKHAIAVALTRDGVPTRNGATGWSATVVAKVLRGREGLGEFRHGGEWHPGRHEPLIDEDTWTAAQALDARSRKYVPGGGGRLPKAHLFVRGMLRCTCGEAMLPRSARDQADVYVCRAHKRDSSSCPIPPLRRDQIDSAALSMFESYALDVEATRTHLIVQLDARAAEAAALGAQAAQQVAELAEQADRVERDYRRGVLPADAYARLSVTIAEERTAADAERERLQANAEALLAARRELDTEHETLTRLAELRRAIAGRVTDASPVSDIGALRAALCGVCAEVRLHSVASDSIVLDYHPVMRDGDEPWQRVGLSLDTANNMSGSGVAE